MLRRGHVDVPSRMSIVGVDDHPMSVLHDLTTVHQPVLLQGQLAARMVLGLLAGEPDVERAITVPTHLVVRGTTAPPAPL